MVFFAYFLSPIIPLCRVPLSSEGEIYSTMKESQNKQAYSQRDV